jgi:uncharacterized membrane protein
MSVSGTELEMLREWTGWFCHKLPERSPHCGNDLFPVCFRCAGVQLGMAASYFGLFASGRWLGRFPSVRMVLGCAALMLPLMLDGLGNALHFWNSPGWVRGLTGLGVGLTLPWLLAPLAQSLEHAGDPAIKPSLENLRQMFWPLLAGVAAIVLLDRGCGPVWFHILATVAAAGWLLFFGHFILALVRAYGNFFTRRFRPLSLKVKA